MMRFTLDFKFKCFISMPYYLYMQAKNLIHTKNSSGFKEKENYIYNNNL